MFNCEAVFLCLLSDMAVTMDQSESLQRERLEITITSYSLISKLIVFFPQNFAFIAGISKLQVLGVGNGLTTCESFFLFISTTIDVSHRTL